MIKKLLSWAMMVSATVSMTSCLSNNNDEDITYYDDTAVTAFSLTTVKRHLHTTASDGVTDSIYTSNYSASTYTFYIDHQKQLIYNPDSLRYGTDASKVVCSVTTKNSGTIVLNLRDKEGKDSLTYYASTDSLDFSSPLRIRVYSLRGTAWREYTVKLNVHQQTGQEMSWNRHAVDALDGVEGRKLIVSNKQTYIFGVKSGKTVVLKQTGTTYTQLTTTFSAAAYQSVVAKDGMLYVLDEGGKVMQSADGESWKQVSSNAELTQIIGASDVRLYALTAVGISSSADNGATWTTDSLDDETANLPTDNLNFVCKASKTNAHTNDLVIVGTRNGETKIWRKVEENASGSQDQPWAFYPADEYNRKKLPALANLQAIGYDGGILAIGGDFTSFYFSNDEGLTWIKTTAYVLPASFGKSAGAFTMTADGDNYIHLSKNGENQIWSGRLARLSWATEQKAFTE